MKPYGFLILCLIITVSLTYCTKSDTGFPPSGNTGIIDTTVKGNLPPADSSNLKLDSTPPPKLTPVVKKDSFVHSKISIVPGSNLYQVPALIYFPVNYNKSKKYPLVIFCHGLGQAGTDLKLMYKGGLPKVLKAGYRPSFDFIMIAPLRTSFSVDPKWLPAILEDARKRFPIDNERIYLTGLSAGGWGTYGSQLYIDPSVGKQFAAIVVCSGMLQTTTKEEIDKWKITKTPIWAVVGEDDTNYKNQNQFMIDEINKRVKDLGKITIRPGFEHTGWDDVYRGKVKLGKLNMWQWLYQFKRT